MKYSLTASVAALLLTSTAAFAETVLVNALGSNPPHMNRLLTTDVAASIVSYPVFETLVVQDKDYVAQPKLATSWEANADATEFSFKLRDGVTFHNGETMTAEDVVFTLSTYLPISPTTSAIKSYIEEIASPEAGVVTVKLNQPYAPFVEMLAGLPIVPKSVYGDGQDVATHPANSALVGTGPFQMVEYASGERVVLARFDGYWGEKSDIDTIVMPIIPDQNARILAFEGGDLDVMEASLIDKSSYDRLKSNEAMATFEVGGGVNTLTAHMNTRSGPLSDAAVRRALYSAINRDMLSERAYYGYGVPSRGAIPAAITWAASPEVDFNKELPFDAAAAAAALDAAGYPIGADGKRFNIRATFPAEYGILNSVAGVIKSNLEEIGVGVDIQGAEFNVWSQRTYETHDYDMSIVFYTSYQDPSVGVSRSYLCNPDNVAFRNSTGLCDEALDAALAKAGGNPDRAARQAAFADAERMILDLMHSYPLIDETSYHFARGDRWDLEATFATTPSDWSLAKAK